MVRTTTELKRFVTVVFRDDLQFVANEDANHIEIRINNDR